MPRPRPLLPIEAKRSLANRFGPLADRLRQFSTKFGLRSHRLFLVWTKFTGENRGEGDEFLVARIEILPTPKISDLSGQNFSMYPGGVLPTGSLRVEKISVGFTESQLMGRQIPGQPPEYTIPQPFDFFYEMVEDDRGGDVKIPARFRMFGMPTRQEGKVSWVVLLERQSEACSPSDRLPPFAPR